MNTIEWFRPDQRPINDDIGAPEISTTVLLYDPVDRIHSFGWFNFNTDKWRSLEEFYFNQGWKWCYLPIPKYE